MAPVNETPNSVNCVGRLVFLLQSFEKGRIYIRRCNARRRRLIVDLISNYSRVVFEVTDNLANHALRMLAKVRIQKIIILPWAIVARWKRWRIGWVIRIPQWRRRAIMRDQNLRVLLIEPG